MLDLRSLAYSSNLDYIETTSERNGYPSNLKGAIIGFDNFEQAEKMAKENNLDIETFEKHDGWNLYYRTGNRTWEEFENHASDFGENYDEYDNSWTKELFFEQIVKPGLENYDDLESLKEYISKKEKIAEEIYSASDDELVITCDGEYYKTIEKKSMSFYYDTKTTVIGLIDNNNE